MHAQSKVETRTKNTHTLQLEDELKKKRNKRTCSGNKKQKLKS